MAEPSELGMVDTGPGAAALNMAVDEMLLVTAAERGSPVLRFYGWTEPAATFGYFQRLDEVERQTRLRPLIRRPTGGGIVPHLRDWTYSLSLPPSSGWYGLKAVESYRAMHAWIVASMSVLGVATELAPCCRHDAPGQCFVGYEQFDVLWGGRKVAGAAQRRNRHGLLIQGSVQPPSVVEHRRAEWQAAMRATAPTAFFVGVRDDGATLPGGVAEGARELAETRYSRAEYNGRR